MIFVELRSLVEPTHRRPYHECMAMPRKHFRSSPRRSRAITVVGIIRMGGDVRQGS
jgi:hypothetical protein